MPNLDLQQSFPNVVIVPGEQWVCAATVVLEGTSTAQNLTNYTVMSKVTVGSVTLATNGTYAAVIAANGTFTWTLSATQTGTFPANAWGTIVLYLDHASTDSLHIATIGFRTSAESI
tara:strand:+ start:712 stop:1062 length:351 start_codon:yes stop_codon:yes gene_type:complete